VDYEDYFPIITTHARLMADAARGGDFDARVPSCPEWNVAKLLKHTGSAHRWSAGVVRTHEPLSPKTLDLGLPDDPAGYPDWLEQGAAALVTTLAAEDPVAACWTWTEDHHVGFWSRRMAFETAVHRWDAQAVGTEPAPFDGALAVDGIDEHLVNLPSVLDPAEIPTTGETLHLHCTDRDGEWLLRFGPAGIEVTPEHAKGDVAVRGTASDLFLLVVGRTPDAVPETFGDAAVLERWQQVLHF
jgi:uncharacterized protein (TIGR03083 family)